MRRLPIVLAVALFAFPTPLAAADLVSPDRTWTSDDIARTIAVAGEGTVFLGHEDGSVTRRDADGSVVWRVTPPGGGAALVALGAPGELIVARKAQATRLAFDGTQLSTAAFFASQHVHGIAPTEDGGACIVVSASRDTPRGNVGTGEVVRVSPAGAISWQTPVTFSGFLDGVAAAPDGGCSGTGDRTARLSSTGAVLWDIPLRGVDVVDGGDGFYVISGGWGAAPDVLARVSYAGTTVWTRDVSGIAIATAGSHIVVASNFHEFLPASYLDLVERDRLQGARIEAFNHGGSAVWAMDHDLELNADECCGRLHIVRTEDGFAVAGANIRPAVYDTGGIMQCRTGEPVAACVWDPREQDLTS